MARFNYPYRSADMKFGSNMIVNFIIICIGIAIIAVRVSIILCKIICFAFIQGSNYFVSKYNSLKSFYPLFCKIAIITILLQLVSLVLYIYLHKTLNIYTPICFIFIFLCCILTASINRINSSNEETIRKKMYIYCWGINALLLIFNTLPFLPYFYYNSFVEYHYIGRVDIYNYITMALLSIFHFVLFALGRFYNTLLKNYESDFLD